MSLVIDKDILLGQILMFEQTVYLAGFTFCESNNCDVYLYIDSPDRFKKVEKAANQLIIKGDYDLIFRVEGYPQFWFLWKDNRLGLYSFLNETLYEDKNELQLLFRK
ncbi:MAG: hypothetical protein HC905_30900 [Bacteroidales bacterium]|nr:hypothetical protein [Bacteroidales bacterium]